MQNAVVWSEIAVADLKRASAFYEKLLDTELAFDKFGPFRIALFPHGEQGVGGCLVHGEGYEPSGKGTVTYLAATPGHRRRARASACRRRQDPDAQDAASRQPGLDRACPGLRGQPHRAPRDELSARAARRPALPHRPVSTRPAPHDGRVPGGPPRRV